MACRGLLGLGTRIGHRRRCLLFPPLVRREAIGQRVRGMVGVMEVHNTTLADQTSAETADCDEERANRGSSG